LIRFIDLTKDYWTHPSAESPCCAFLCTSTDKFVGNSDSGFHVFDSLEEIQEHPRAERLLPLVPDGFFYVSTERDRDRQQVERGRTRHGPQAS
jgi:hypothetical protein